MISDVEPFERGAQHRQQLRIAVSEGEHSAVQVKVEVFLAVQVPESIALTPAHHQIDAELVKPLYAARDDVIVGQAQHAGLLSRHLSRGLIAHDWIHLAGILRRWIKMK